MAAKARIFRRAVNSVNKVVIALQRIGIAFGPQYLLTTTGHRTGQQRTTPITIIAIADQRYVHQAYPKSAWVANVRASHTAVLSRGRRREAVTLVELPLDQRRTFLREHFAHAPGHAAGLLVTTGLIQEATPQAVAAAADRIAVFRIETHPEP
ncbi:nitroreductase/quinone reductase family protein [Nocardia alba]|uniref:Deazaflavin-dependent oxidoreductase (Nitroreductase family) n=1 Tax=Nocardia alba TaxID=225051 RepID=A0A4R1FLH8_9NOCA|nr:nitroreductase/quinone reductase family protein [Nocardia alba]TCJ95677.1 deazaflavin-dependent oxidoreductase (nitroreductase family) [Nocardia alba]